jgi:Probable Zinc-ribbon domain
MGKWCIDTPRRAQSREVGASRPPGNVPSQPYPAILMGVVCAPGEWPLPVATFRPSLAREFVANEEVRLWERLAGEEVDLYVPAGRIIVEFDARYGHSTTRNHRRNQCKSQHLADAGYRVLRIREAGLDPTGSWDRFVSRYPTAWQCVQVIAADLAEALGWSTARTLRSEQVTAAVARAARRWHEMGDRRDEDFLPARTDLLAEFIENVTRPGVAATMIALGSADRCRWRCATCGREWVSQVRARSGRTRTSRSRPNGTGCPQCLRAWRSTNGHQLVPPPGRSLADLAPVVAAEFRENLTRPGRGPGELRCGSQDRCRWCCAACGWVWEAAVHNRVGNGTGCPVCGRGRQRPVVDTG